MNIEKSIERLSIAVATSKFETKDYPNCIVMKQDLRTLLTAYEKEKEKNKNAYRKANNYLYFNDSADYEVALWEVIRTLRPDLAEKWDNGEYANLEYIKEE